MGTKQPVCCDKGKQKATGTANQSCAAAQTQESVYKVVDRTVTLLIAAGAAMAANCEPCLNKIVADLKGAGVGTNDIRRAVEIGQFVKDKPAAAMKELADELTGTRLAAHRSSAACPLGESSSTCG
jgi:alkylhydroperoxidase/carboxymuconolactone decarboxylase family protein YurZ